MEEIINEAFNKKLAKIALRMLGEAESFDLSALRPRARKRFNEALAKHKEKLEGCTDAASYSASERFSNPDESFEDFLALTINNRHHWSFYQFQLDQLRNFSRLVADTDEIAKNVLLHYQNHIVGECVTVTIVPKHIKDPLKLADEISGDKNIVTMNENWEAFYEGNNLTDKLLNWVMRAHRDGEAIVRKFAKSKTFAGKEIPEIRFVEPYFVRGEDRDTFLHLGVRTRKGDKETVEEITVYQDIETKSPDETIPADEIIFDKRNVDTDTERGISTFFPVLTNLRRIQKNLVNVSVLTSILSAIAFVRKHQVASAAKVINFVRNNSDGVQRTNKVTGKEDSPKRKTEPGTVLDAPAGIEYEFPAHNIRTDNYIQVIDKELASVACAFVLPVEWLKATETPDPLGDGHPTTRNFKREQGILFRYLTDLFWYVQEQMGVEPELRTQYQIQFFGPILSTADPEAQARMYEIEQRVGSLSPQSIAAMRGRNYATERANTILHRRTQQPGEVMPGDVGNTNVQGNNPSASSGGDGITKKPGTAP